jgi:hypothetical protein
MNRPRLVRWLRITWTAFWGIVVVLLIAMWIRSCWTVDAFRIPLVGSYSCDFGSACGRVCLGFGPFSNGQFEWIAQEVETCRKMMSEDYQEYYNGIWGRFKYVEKDSIVTIPNWFLICMALALLAVPWTKWSNRFSYVGACQV